MYRLYWMYIRVCSEKEKSKISPKKSEFKKKYEFFSTIHQKRLNTASAPVFTNGKIFTKIFFENFFFAKFHSFHFHIFASLIFAKKFAKYERKLSHFSRNVMLAANPSVNEV